MEVLNAMDLLSGKTTAKGKFGSTFTQPIQMIPQSEKTPEWMAWCADYFEWQGMKQLQRNARKLLKNAKLVKGIIDKTDYIVQEDNEMGDLIDTLTKEDQTALELKFYPIIPNMFNILVNEFSKRSTKITYRSVDEYAYNELFAQKHSQIEEVLIAQAQEKVLANLLQQGIDPNDELVAQQLSPENLKTLPEIQSFFTKSYQSIPEQWATHQHQVDVERFHMDELEITGFGDSLTYDREFWHIRMLEDDYQVELWNPVLTFYHKSPSTRYISDSSYVGKIDMMTVADVIDTYGWLMNEDQLLSLQQIYPVKSAGYAIGGVPNDGSFYDSTRSHAWNTNLPSLGMRQYLSVADNFVNKGGDIVSWILGESEDFLDYGNEGLLRVATIYFKSQRKLGHLTAINGTGDPVVKIVTEDYEVTTDPVYDTSVFTEKSSSNLVYGEHIDWIWINDPYGVVKIGPNLPGMSGMMSGGNDFLNPIYLGISDNKPGRLNFPFKGDDSIYGSKLPVEGCIFSDRNTRSTTFVDNLKPFQIGYNIVNNQIADILVDELGTVIMFDQNLLPRKALNGDDWSDNPYARAYVAMKNFQMLLIDQSMSNVQGSLAGNQPYQALNLEQTNRIASRVSLANYFKSEAYASVGATPQRMGQPIERETAKGQKENLNSSYVQTEHYFTHHCDNLMPRVHKMRTDAAQFYNSSKPSVRLQYTTNSEERVFFKTEGTKLLLSDLNVFCSTKTNLRSIMEEMKAAAKSNNTTGMTIFDLGKILKTESLSEIEDILEEIERKRQAEIKAKQDSDAEIEKMRLEAQAKEKADQREFELMKEREANQKDVVVASIRAAGFSGTKDMDKNGENDYSDALENIRKTDEYQSTMNLAQQKEENKQRQHDDKIQLGREKLSQENQRDITNLQISREKSIKDAAIAKKKAADVKKKR